jgi:DNA-nicking Smr family endonuclease
MRNNDKWEPEVVEYPIDGTIDLHTFRPQDVEEVVTEYIEACLERKIPQIRIIHGKGKGVLREIVHSVLDRHPSIVSYRHDSSRGSWGATVAVLDLPPMDCTNE